MTRSHKQGGGSWQLLGTWVFDGAGTEYVEVSNANGKATADAVRFVSQGTPTTPDTAILYSQRPPRHPAGDDG